MGVRDRPPADPLALPVGRHPRLPPPFVGDGPGRPNGTVYKEVGGKPPVINLQYYKPTNRDGRPFMPVEFAVAAYRFGHSIIRPFYVINDDGSARRRTGLRPEPGFNLNGGRPIPFSPIPPASTTWSWSGRTSSPSTRTSRLGRPARSTPNCRCHWPTCPGSVVPPTDPTVHLAVRNSLRGKQVGLPSGQQVAKAMRVTALSNAATRAQQRSRLGWPGAALVLHPEGGGTAAVQRRAARASRRQDRGRGPRRAPAAGPQLVPVPQRRHGSPRRRSLQRPVNSGSSTC